METARSVPITWWRCLSLTLQTPSLPLIGASKPHPWSWARLLPHGSSQVIWDPILEFTSACSFQGWPAGAGVHRRDREPCSQRQEDIGGRAQLHCPGTDPARSPTSLFSSPNCWTSTEVGVVARSGSSPSLPPSAGAPSKPLKEPLGRTLQLLG